MVRGEVVGQRLEGGDGGETADTMYYMREEF